MVFNRTTRAAKKKANQKAKDSELLLNKALNNAGPLFSEASKEARKKFDSLYSEYSPRVQKELSKRLADGEARFLDAQARLSSKFDENVGPRMKNFRADLEADYLPRARRTADAANTTLSAAVAAAVDAARAEWEKGSPAIRSAALSNPVQDKKKSRWGTIFIALGLTAVAGAAAYVAWEKTRPVEDPWAPPADFARSQYPAAGSTDADSTEVSDSVASADAGDVTESLSTDKADDLAATDSLEKKNTHKDV